MPPGQADFPAAPTRSFTFLGNIRKQSFIKFLFSFTKQVWCLCNNGQWMTINTTKQVFYLSCCEAVKSAPLPRADPQRQAVPCISMESGPRRGLLRKVLRKYKNNRYTKYFSNKCPCYKCNTRTYSYICLLQFSRWHGCQNRLREHFIWHPEEQN